MKRKPKQWTTEDAARLFQESGISDPTPERIERAARILAICEEQVGLTDWNERLYPKLDGLEDVEVFRAIEEAFGTPISDAVYEQTDARTFGDLVLFYDQQITAIAARRARENAKISRAACATQTAFYLLRRRLSDTGVSYYQAHDLGPNALDFRLTEKQAAQFVDDLRYDLGLSLRYDRFIGNGVRTGDVVTAFLLTTGFVIATVVARCTDMVSGSTLWGGFLGFVVWVLLGTAFARVTNRYSWFRLYKVRREYQTLGDVARDLASTIQAPPSARPATS